MSKRALIALAVVAALSLASCDTGISTPGSGIGREGWWTTPPDDEGYQYECLYWSISESTAIWCKPEPVWQVIEP